MYTNQIFQSALKLTSVAEETLIFHIQSCLCLSFPPFTLGHDRGRQTPKNFGYYFNLWPLWLTRKSQRTFNFIYQVYVSINITQKVSVSANTKELWDITTWPLLADQKNEQSQRMFHLISNILQY